MSSYAHYRRLLGYVRPHWKLFALSLSATMVMAATEPAMPALMKPLIDGSFVEKDPDMIVLMPILLVLLFVVRGISTFVGSVAMQSVATHVVYDIRRQMIRKLLNLPIPYYDANASGVMLSKVTFNVEQLTGAATNSLVILVRDSLAIIGLLGWITYINWRLALIALAIIPIVIFSVKKISKRLKSISKVLQERMGEMTHTLEEVINGVKVVKLFNGSDYESGRFDHTANRVRQFKVKHAASNNAIVQTLQLLAASAMALMAYLAAQQSAQGNLTAGEFVSFFIAMGMLLTPLKRLTGVTGQLQMGLAAAESVFALLDQTEEHDTGIKTLEKVHGKIEWRHVGFSYESAGRAALTDISLTIKPGENIAFVGPSGSGKTTLTNLAPRFYLPSEGEILIDDVETSEYTLKSLREHIALVSQDIILFNDTVRENIAYGALHGTTEEEIRDAAKAANALEFIEAMPDGFDQLIGDNGVRLSGGQRQRIAIARALLKNAPILIFDEATSALDTESEQKIQQAMETLRQGRTTLTIAHRLSTIEQADRIIVLDQGRIVESGTHQQLISNNGLYQKLYQIQLSTGEQAL
jgi:subfamily B ATP-binding cassette protein MsbA